MESAVGLSNTFGSNGLYVDWAVSLGRAPASDNAEAKGLAWRAVQMDDVALGAIGLCVATEEGNGGKRRRRGEGEGGGEEERGRQGGERGMEGVRGKGMEE